MRREERATLARPYHLRDLMSKKQKVEKSPEERRAYWEGDLLPLSVVVEHIKESQRQFFNEEFTMMYDLMYQVIATFPVHGFHHDLHHAGTVPIPRAHIRSNQ